MVHQHDGELEAALELAEAVTLGADEHADLAPSLEELPRPLGRLPEARALEETGRSDILVLASFMEGLPVVLMEAMALGVPVIAPDVAGIPELVEDGRTGMLVPPGDVAALADALRLLLRNPELRGAMAVQGPITARRRFSLERAAVDLYALVSAQLSTAPAAPLHPATADPQHNA